MTSRVLSRRWRFILNDPMDDDILNVMTAIGVEYAVWQLEGNEYGIHRFQGYFICPHKIHINVLLAAFAPERPQFQVATGGTVYNRNHCVNSPNRIGDVTEIGIYPNPVSGNPLFCPN